MPNKNNGHTQIITNLKGQIAPGVTFYETVHQQHQLQTVTRVTDREFDTLCNASKELVVRSLGLWENKRFTESISQLRFPALNLG